MSSFCSACGTTIEGDDRFCRVCGAAVGSPPAVIGGFPDQPRGPTKTSTKAVVSLILGLFIFFFPFSLVAVILGHLSLAEIRKSSGRITGNGLAIAGLILGYIGVAAIPIILIIAAIAIPNLLRARMAANESSAVDSVRMITTAQITYQSSHSEAGFACSLSELSDAQLIDSEIGRGGPRNGYRFEIRGCAPDTRAGAHINYQIVAYPVVTNQTGVRAFCADESAVIKVDASGSPKKCLEQGRPL
jgi:type IV pilus assembly protein PilA